MREEKPGNKKMGKAASGDTGIAFFIPYYLHTEKSSYSIGTAYIAAYLKEKGISSVLATGGTREGSRFLESLKNNGARILGIYTCDPLFPRVSEIAREARRVLPEILIIAGGYTATFADDILLNHIPEVDIVVRGEGEETVYELYRYTEGIGNLEDIKGISFRDGDRIIRTENRPLIGLCGKRGAELDILPSPYAAGILPGSDPEPGIVTGRGCIFSCNFCCSKEMYGESVRYHSIERVIRDLRIIHEKIKDYRERPKVNFWDSNLCFSKTRTRRLFEAIIEEDFNFNITAQVRADMVDRELLSLMYRAGVRGLSFGLESAVPGVLRNIEKVRGKSADFREEKEYIESVRWAVKDCQELGIDPVVNVIYGLPGETFQDAMTTVEMIKEMDLKTYRFSHFMVYVGSKIYRDHEKYGMKVWQDKNILPLKVEHPYDVYSVPALPNSFSTNYCLSSIESLESSLFEWWDTTRPLSRLFRPHMVLEDYHQVGDKLAKWMKEVLDFYSEVVFRYDETRPAAAETRAIRKKLGENRLGSIFLVLNRSFVWLPEGMRKYRLKSANPKMRPLFCPENYIAYPFRNIGAVRRSSTGSSTVFYNIDSRQDAAAFIEEMSRSSVNMEHSISGRMIKNGIMLASACRFTGHPCPARSLHKILVHKNGKIAPCEHGGSIGVIGDSREDLMGQIKKLAAEEEKKRGCSSCPAKEHCSRCLFTTPFTTDEYCEIVRNDRHLPRIFQFLLICHDARLKERLNSVKGLPPPDL
ncbi:MAG: B12-binding domain-containing radical SAM protein [Chloroflexi bacterium]|nr:B12-binding domain-containing radical SAM protein [Chloroflexota bacterium]